MSNGPFQRSSQPDCLTREAHLDRHRSRRCYKLPSLRGLPLPKQQGPQGPARPVAWHTRFLGERGEVLQSALAVQHIHWGIDQNSKSSWRWHEAPARSNILIMTV